MKATRDSTIFLIALLFVVAHPLPASALAISVAGLFNIVDGGAGDTDGVANGTITFNQLGANIALSGSLSEVILAGVSTQLTLTNFNIDSFAAGGLVTNSVRFSSSVFAAAGPQAFAGMTLNGRYTRSTAIPGFIVEEDINVTGYVNGLPGVAGSIQFGNIDPAGVKARRGDVAFNGATPIVEVPVTTQLNGILDFTVGGDRDRIRLPDSLVLGVASSIGGVPLPAPEPPMTLLLITGLLLAIRGGARTVPIP